MEPSFPIFKQKNQVKSQSDNKHIIECPSGTVPILRTTKEYVANAQYWAEKHFNPLTVESHGTHIAGVRAQGGGYRGLSAWMTVHDLNVSRDQASYAHIYAGSGIDNKVNFIQTGWMVNPSLFGDGRTWGFGYWKGANGKGCYNTICPGFIQVSKTEPLSGPISYSRGRDMGLYVRIIQDFKSGDWWITHVKPKETEERVGYWPKELFDLMAFNVDMVGVGGAVQASPSGRSPPIGSGHLPSEGEKKSARVEKFDIVDYNFKVKGGDEYKLEKLLDSNKCYGLKDKKSFWYGDLNVYTYGGPGGDSCGI